MVCPGVEGFHSGVYGGRGGPGKIVTVVCCGVVCSRMCSQTVSWRGLSKNFALVTVARRGNVRFFTVIDGPERRWFAPGVCGGRYSQCRVSVFVGVEWYYSTVVTWRGWRGTVCATVHNNSQIQY